MAKISLALVTKSLRRMVQIFGCHTSSVDVWQIGLAVVKRKVTDVNTTIKA